MTLFARFQALPKNAEPIASWKNRDEAFYDVVRGINVAIETLRETQRQRREEARKAEARAKLEAERQRQEAERQAELQSQIMTKLSSLNQILLKLTLYQINKCLQQMPDDQE
jgi:predicted RNase H-like nuclease (RuvC/YqgF family)